MTALTLHLGLLLFIVQSAYCSSNYKNGWEVMIKTCDVEGAGTDASVYLKLYYLTEHDQQTFYLNSYNNDFERNQLDRFNISMMHPDLIKIGLYYWPSGTLGEAWCVDYVFLKNPVTQRCIMAAFDTWIGYYHDPPTYPRTFRETPYDFCDVKRLK